VFLNSTNFRAPFWPFQNQRYGSKATDHAESQSSDGLENTSRTETSMRKPFQEIITKQITIAGTLGKRALDIRLPYLRRFKIGLILQNTKAGAFSNFRFSAQAVDEPL
jgi:hypothetical protein